MDKCKMSSNILEISEYKSYLELTRRSCYYDYPNGNNVQLNSDNAQEMAETLINQPVVAKYRKIAGKDDLGGHECSIDKDGNITWGTATIGVNTAVEIRNDDITTVDGKQVNTPCLFVTSRIWKRNKSVCDAIQRLFTSGQLHSSWEIMTEQSEVVNGIKILKKYTFDSDCLLGSKTKPAYGDCATTLCMASLEDPEMLMVEALTNDIYKKNDNKEEDQLVNVNETSAVENVVSSVEEVNTENVIAENTEVVEPVVEPTEVVEENTITEPVSAEEHTNATPEIDAAQLTYWDLRTKVREACREKLDKWCYVSFMFPNEKEVWCEYDGRDTELDYVKFTYEVGEGDVISVSEPEYVKLTVSIAEINSKIDELTTEIANVKAELDTRNNVIAEANETIQNLKTEVAELKPYKEQIEIAEQKKVEAAIAAEKEALRNRLLKGNLFTEAEINEPNIQELIEARDSSAINNLIAERFIASFDSKEEKIEETTVASVEEEVVSASVNLEIEEPEMDVRSFMSKFLFNN